ncbi:MAG: hypothetical protein JXA92_11295 [candidate division Zixibacteria bacterium]|nr:hypothetical protein [candidate division Zixibacteria bacterium]
MKKTLIIIVLGLILRALPATAEPGVELDSNTAFYEGEFYNYVIPAPNNFKMLTVEAQRDGYSFAFIPQSDSYDSAAVLIGVHIYKIRGMTFLEALEADTGNIRGYFGADLIIYPVDSIFNATGDRLTGFYLNKKKEFIPNVMLSYYDGQSELIIFELVISEKITRVRAEDIYINCIGNFKALHKGELGAR